MPEQFKLPIASLCMYVLAPLILAGASIYFFSLPFGSSAQTGNCSDDSPLLWWVASIGGGLCALGILALAGPLRRLTQIATSADEDGLWPTGRGKAAALLPWREVADLKEHRFLKRLDLLDGDGRVRLRLEYQLSDFQRLRTLVLDRAALKPLPAPAGGHLLQPWSQDLLSFGGNLLLAGLCAYAYGRQPLFALGGAALFLGLAANDYLTTPRRLHLRPDGLDVAWPFKRVFIAKESIHDFAVEDDRGPSSRATRVAVLRAEPGVALYLCGFGLPSTSLCRLLRAWHHGPR